MLTVSCNHVEEQSVQAIQQQKPDQKSHSLSSYDIACYDFIKGWLRASNWTHEVLFSEKWKNIQMSLWLKQNKMSASEVLTLFPFKWSRFFWGYWQIFVHVLNISHNVIFLFKYILILKSLYFCLVFQCKCAPLLCICFSMVFFQVNWIQL